MQNCAPSACADCPSAKICKSAKPIHTINIPSHISVILVMSGKGGVGKSTVSCSLSYELAKYQKHKVMLIDLDIHGPSIAHMINATNSIINTEFDSDHFFTDVFLQAYADDNCEHSSENSKNQFFNNDSMKHDGEIKINLVSAYTPVSDNQIMNMLKRAINLYEKTHDKCFIVIDMPPGIEDQHLTVVNLFKQKNQQKSIYEHQTTCSNQNNTEENDSFIKMQNYSQSLFLRQFLDDSKIYYNGLFTLLVSTDTRLSKLDLLRQITFCEKSNLKILGCVENMTWLKCECGNKININECSQSFDQKDICNQDKSILPLKLLLNEFDIPLLCSIPLRKEIAKSCDEGKVYRILKDVFSSKI